MIRFVVIAVRSLRGVDDDDHRNRRIARRQEADKRRVVIRVRVAPVDQLLRRAGLPGDREAVDLRALRRALGDNALHDRRQRGRCIRRHDPALPEDLEGRILVSAA